MTVSTWFRNMRRAGVRTPKRAALTALFLVVFAVVTFYLTYQTYDEPSKWFAIAVPAMVVLILLWLPILNYWAHKDSQKEQQ
ncbi:hypothetical protein [Nocardia otitidiscaviarum]|uniref:hypothetical protein n=1 Tax=Nocardia otitidiscaviarum TaxID=1823 RepID=UPI002457CE7D|nr:hypothetical protein [Nocardia otitidiscaviarum]